ncbi:hypothetical protein MNBD_BACTEROID02-730 [hydrothermal vent metagenome]|uniref:Uncharacterized protein n=1 Tax=hydrothermal vent metagenome TaxID=652676 RepID=A0A3B0QXA9_9ZZZZ
MNREIGSSFYELHESDREFQILKQYVVTLDINFAYYYSGRNAILALLKNITNKQTINTIWLPEYYCDTVVNLVLFNFNNIKYYAINPFEFNEEIEITTFASRSDIVILNNYWGLSTFGYQDKNRPIIIEDHSHGWLSKQSLHSKADYCFCSLRKTYPIPLGAIIWSPNSKNDLNIYKNIEDKSILKALTSFDKSMRLKRKFIKEKEIDLKKEYLSFLNKGEDMLCLSNTYTEPKKVLISKIKNYINLDVNCIKNEHLEYIYKHLDTSKHFKIIKRDGFTSFGLLLLFKDKSMFNAFKTQLISDNIYPAHLWPNTTINTGWKYLFNIHVDFRYNIEDICYLVEKINLWSKNNV